MKFFDTYKTMGVATEIMGITPEGKEAIEKVIQDTVRKH
jgi:methylmalonyl-CoA/ethylmalonyl-CoA epimerase